MNDDIIDYNTRQTAEFRLICERLGREIDTGLPNAECKIWHGQPVWFLDGNPIAGYRVLKGRVRLMFWSGADFEETGLNPGTGKFKDAHKEYTSADEIDRTDIQRWLQLGKEIQWDYQNIIKNKGLVQKLA